jgi:hypothetical protein
MVRAATDEIGACEINPDVIFTSTCCAGGARLFGRPAEQNPAPSVSRAEKRTMPARSSRDLPGPSPRKDEQREQQNAVIQDADKTEGRDRDKIHGDGHDLLRDKD